MASNMITNHGLSECDIYKPHIKKSYIMDLIPSHCLGLKVQSFYIKREKSPDMAKKYLSNGMVA